mgnify:CR=1 FL=1
MQAVLEQSQEEASWLPPSEIELIFNQDVFKGFNSDEYLEHPLLEKIALIREKQARCLPLYMNSIQLLKKHNHKFNKLKQQGKLDSMPNSFEVAIT